MLNLRHCETLILDAIYRVEASAKSNLFLCLFVSISVSSAASDRVIPVSALEICHAAAADTDQQEQNAEAKSKSLSSVL